MVNSFFRNAYEETKFFKRKLRNQFLLIILMTFVRFFIQKIRSQHLQSTISFIKVCHNILSGKKSIEVIDNGFQFLLSQTAFFNVSESCFTKIVCIILPLL